MDITWIHCTILLNIERDVCYTQTCSDVAWEYIDDQVACSVIHYSVDSVLKLYICDWWRDIK